MNESSSGLGVVTTDRRFTVRSWNAWLAAATGLAEPGVVGRSLFDVLASDRVETYRDLLTEVVETGTSRVLAPAFHHYAIACPPREPSAHYPQMQQRVTVAPLCDDGGVVGAILTIEDVTARLDRERTLAIELERDRSGALAADALGAMGSDDWRLRGAAVRSLQQAVSSDEVRHLLESLQREHHDLNVLNSALRVLIAADRSVTEPLIELLADPEPNVRMHAALALGELKGGATVAALVGALDDPDANVRFHAIEALGKCGAPEAVDRLAAIAQSGDFFVAFAAIDALARTQDARVAPRLAAMLDDPLLRPAVVDTLAVLGDEESVPALAGLINRGAAGLAAVAAALTGIHARYDADLEAGAHIQLLVRAAITPDGARHLAGTVDKREPPLAPAVTVLGWVGANAIQALIGALEVASVQATVSEAIAAIGRDAIEPLLARLDGADRDVRPIIAGLLGRLGDRRAVPALIALLSSADAELTATAAAALAGLGDPRAFEPLLGLFGHEHATVRRAAIAAVNSIGAEGAARQICGRLAHADPKVRDCALRVAGYFGFRECAAAIVDALRDPQEEVRRAAIEQLPHLDEPRALVALLAALREETPRNRAAAAHALRSADGSGVNAALRTALSDPDAWVRYFAAGSLERAQDRGAADLVAGLAANDPAIHVRIAAIRALVVLDPPRAGRMASELACHPDDDLACAAVEVLAAAGGANADDEVEDALQSPRDAVRAAAVNALGSRTTARAAEVLAWAARLTEPDTIGEQAIAGLRRIAAADDDEGRATAVGVLLDLAADGPQEDAAVAAFAGLPARIVAEVGLGLQARRVSARIAAVRALARMRQPSASEALLRALADPEATVREAAVVAFGQLGTRAAAAALFGLSAADPDQGVRRRAAIVCARYGWGQPR